MSIPDLLGPIEKAETLEWKKRLGTILAKMRVARFGTMTRRQYAEKLGTSVRQIERTENGASLSPTMIGLYERNCEDKILIFLASEHPPGCTGSLTVQRESTEKVASLEIELKQAQIDNGRLRGIIKRHDRIFNELRAAGIIQ